MFTKTGEVNNSPVVAKYATEYSTYFYSPTVTFPATGFRSFSFVSDDSIINTSINPVAELKRTVISDYDVFTGKFSVPVNDTNALNLHLGKYKLFKYATTPLGYTYLELNDPAAILKKVNDKVYVPFVRYIVVSTGQNTFSFVADRFNNVFDATGISKLGTRDTLLIQTFDVELRRKL
ncbi:MAG TPA: hypothetical protein VF622_16695 [Segetibacter sp.]|jgi:hypothetical protein